LSVVEDALAGEVTAGVLTTVVWKAEDVETRVVDTTVLAGLTFPTLEQKPCRPEIAE
jgi:hypothetical protein